MKDIKSNCVEYPNGSKFWYLKDILHRANDLPAVEYLDGSKYWYINGKRHRTNGPAIERSDGIKEWFLNDKIIEPIELVKQGFITMEEIFVELI